MNALLGALAAAALAAPATDLSKAVGGWSGKLSCRLGDGNVAVVVRPSGSGYDLQAKGVLGPLSFGAPGKVSPAGKPGVYRLELLVDPVVEGSLRVGAGGRRLVFSTPLPAPGSDAPFVTGTAEFQGERATFKAQFRWKLLSDSCAGRLDRAD